MLFSLLDRMLSTNTNVQMKPWSEREVGKTFAEAYLKQKTRNVLNLISGNDTGNFSFLETHIYLESYSIAYSLILF